MLRDKASFAIRRLFLFELSDLSFCPQVFRNLETEFLHFLWTMFPIYRDAVPILQNCLEQTECNQIVDLCSGSGGPILSLLPYFPASDICLILSDKYPNKERIREIEQTYSERVRFCSSSVDATNVPTRLKGFRTLFTSFHHFNPEQAHSILLDAVANSPGIAIFEATYLSPFHILRELSLPLLALVLTPFIKPFSWKRFFWTYAIPVLPLLLLFNGTMSDLRSYTKDEFKKLTDSESLTDFSWNIGSLSSFFGRLTYVIGVKRARTIYCRYRSENSEQ